MSNLENAHPTTEKHHPGHKQIGHGDGDSMQSYRHWHAHSPQGLPTAHSHAADKHVLNSLHSSHSLEIPPIHHLLPPKGHESGRLNGSLSVSQLVQSHVFKAAGDHDKTHIHIHTHTHTQTLTGHSSEEPAQDKKSGAGEVRTKPVEKIRIVYNSAVSDDHHNANQASFSVDKHGAIKVLANPDKHNGDTLVVNVDRSPGELGKPNSAEQKSLDMLVGYLSDHFEHRDHQNKTQKPLVEDQLAVVGASEKRYIHEMAKPEDHFPERTKNAIERMHRFSGAGSGHISSHDLNGYFAGGQAKGDAETRAYKDVISGMNNGGHDHPYEAVGSTGEGRVGVGRYMLRYDLLNAWLNEHPEKRAEFQKRPQFLELLQELKNNQQPSDALLKAALPDSTQEQITSDLIKDFEKQMPATGGKVDAAKLALSFYLGHVPSAEEAADPANQTYLGAAKRLTSLSVARTLYPDEGFGFQTGTDNKGCSTLALKLAAASQRESSGSHAHGRCSHYVRKAFDSVDPSLDRLFAGYAKDDHLGDDPRFRQICDDKSQLASVNLQPGDTIIYGPKVGTNSAGHIETMGLDHLMHSDFSHKLTAHFASEYQWLKVYRPVASA